MSSITLRDIPPQLEEVIRKRADIEGLSLDETVIRMLEEAARKHGAAGTEVRDDLDQLAGTWSEEEAAAFEAALLEQRRIDPELWE